MDSSSSLEAVPENDLVVIPRPQNPQGQNNKRAFQKRRRSRACDACRLRKTKCDAPPEGTCSSCASASLLCKFSDPESEKKKIGPARRLRMLETTVQELNEKLKIAEAKLQSGEHSSIDINNAEIQSSSSEIHISATNRRADSPSNSNSTVAGNSPSDRSPRLSISQPVRRVSYDTSTNDDLFVGTTSGLGFLASIQEYVERLGYDTTSLLDTWKSTEAKAFPTNIPVYNDGSQMRDLRTLLPPKPAGNKLLNIFHHTTARVAPIFYWPLILNKFERAYEAPIYSNDQPTVTGVFCVLMVIYAYASLCSDDLDVFEAPVYNSSRRGWHFFECAKKFHDLNQPMYSIADAEVLMVMGMYLDLSALPSPAWMTIGSLARVCQDLGLHRKPAEGKFTPPEYEHRSRMFWCTFLLDRKLALQFGRPPTLDEEEIDMDEPGRNDTSDLMHLAFDAAPVGVNTFVGSALFQQMISNARYIDPILRLNAEPGNEQQIEYRIYEIEQKLDAIERNFPEGIFDWENCNPLDPVLVKHAVLAMATRLSMYRYFTDASLDHKLRTRCFIRSVEVGKSTVHLLNRMMKYPEWERGFRLYQSELCYQHTFKVSIIILLASTIFTKPFQVATSGELNTCLKALQAAAPSRPTVAQSLHLFDEVAKILKNKHRESGYTNHMDAPPSGIPYNNLEYDASSTSFNVSVSPTSLTSSASGPSIPTNTLSADHKSLYVPPIVPSNDLRVDPQIVPKFWPNYESYGRAGLGFSTLKLPSPSENTNWMNHVDPSYWTLMENVLSHETNIHEQKRQ